MDDEGAVFTVLVCILSIVLGCFIGNGCGRDRLAENIANGTHVVEVQKRCDELEKAIRSCRGNASVLIESEACPGCTAVCITADEALSRLTPDADASGEGVGK